MRHNVIPDMHLSIIPLLLPALVLDPVPSEASAAPMAVADERVDDLIQRGRKHLDAGDMASAKELFLQADAETDGALESRMWVLRIWFLEGRINDAFDEVDRLAEDNEGAALDYLYGMGSYLKAMAYIAQGVPSSTTDFNLQDAASFLGKALEADAGSYYDAWFPMADAAYRTRQYDKATKPAGKAMEVEADRARAFQLAGRVAFQRSNAARALENGAEQAATLHEEAMGFFEEALERVPAEALILAGGDETQAEGLRTTLKAELLLDMGLSCHYSGDLEAARKFYADSIGWNPNGLDLGQYWGSLGTTEEFVAMLEDATAKFTERWGEKSPSDATVLWHLGWGYYQLERWADCEGAYERVLAKWPAYVDSHHHIAMSRYQRADYVGATEAWHEYSKLNRESLLQTIAANPDGQAILAYTLGKCAEKAAGNEETRPEPEHNLHAVFLAKMIRDLDETNWRNHNDLGLFSRDAGDFLRWRNREEDREEVTKLYEQSLQSYETAMRMAPEMPHLPNDTAVILHYCLERDYERAIELYKLSYELSSALLEKGGLDEEMMQFATLGKRDSKNNMDALLKKIEEEKEGDDG